MAGKRFSFSPEMTAELLEYLKQYKTERDFGNIDFNSDKAKQHEYVRRQMAENNPQYFGPVKLGVYEDEAADEMEKRYRETIAKRDKAEILKGYQHVQERVKKKCVSNLVPL